MQKTFGLIVAGSRDFNDYDFLKARCDEALENKIKENYRVEIISGTCRGADKLGETYGMKNRFNLRLFPANWDLYGKIAGYKRNELMAIHAKENYDECGCILFIVNNSKGSIHMKNLAEKHGIKTIVYNV